MRLSSGPFPSASSLLKSRATLTFAMLAFVFEALFVPGRASRAVELRMPAADAAFVLIERPMRRTA